MEMSGVSAASTASTASTASSTQISPVNQTASQGLGEGAFMQLLLAQLQNQDPLKPMEDTDFIAQLAQFNSLNQLTKMSQTLEDLVKAQGLSQGSALIGKTVSGLSNSGSVITGIVSGLQLSGDKIVLNLNGDQMPLNNVQSVEETERSDDDGGQTQQSGISSIPTY